MIDFRRLGTAAMFLILLAAGPARAAPEVGWWWNPNESGRGFFVESQNGIIYLAGYFYEPDGRATWLVSGGPNTDSYNYQGRLLSYSNGQTLFGDYKPPTTPLDAGPVSISFSDDTHGTIVWPGGTIPIVRQGFGAGTAAFGPDSGWWWNEAESGRGYSIEVQGDKIFVVGFMYDAAGNPVWYYSAGTMATPTTYAGPWLQFAGGQTQLGPYQPPGAPVVVGQLSIEFTATHEATLTFQDARAAAPTSADQRKRSKEIKIGRQFKPKDFALPKAWKGGFGVTNRLQLLKDAAGTKPGQTTIIVDRWEATDIVVEEDLSSPEMRLPGFTTYVAKSSAIVVYIDFLSVSTDNKQKCESSPNYNVVFSLVGDLFFQIVAGNRGQYVTALSWRGEGKEVMLPITCEESGKAPSRSEVPITLVPGPEFTSPEGTIVGGVITATIPEKTISVGSVGNESATQTTRMSWYFKALK